MVVAMFDESAAPASWFGYMPHCYRRSASAKANVAPSPHATMLLVFLDRRRSSQRRRAGTRSAADFDVSPHAVRAGEQARESHGRSSARTGAVVPAPARLRLKRRPSIHWVAQITMSFLWILVAAESFADGGNVDHTFAQSGYLFSEDSLSGRAQWNPYAVVATADGHVLAGGWAPGAACNKAAALFRFSSSGSPDPGSPIPPYANCGSANNAQIGQLANHGSNYVVATMQNLWSGSPRFEIWRLEVNGVRDLTFGNGGVRPVDWWGEYAFLAWVKTLPASDGSMHVVGEAHTTSGGVAFVAVRLDAFGHLISHYGDGGKVGVQFGGSYFLPPNAVAAVGGSVYFVANALSLPAWGAIYRIAPAGSLDRTYGDAGVARVPSAAVAGAAVGNNGELFVVGTAEGKGLILKLQSDGSRSDDFGAHGEVLLFQETQSNFAFHSVLPQGDGKIVVLGSENGSGFPSRMHLTRISASGVVDSSFGSNGWRMLDAVDSSINAGILVPHGLDGFLVTGELSHKSASTGTNVWRYFMARVHGSDAQGDATAAIEYYREEADHYFVTASLDEQVALDEGRFPGWGRTGLSFRVLPRSLPGSTAVCRFYLPPASGGSHFYGRDPVECAAAQIAHPEFLLESTAVFSIYLPAAGKCVPGTTPIYRVFNGRRDANHRYTSSRDVRDAMVSQGWVAEGEGPDIVAMCAP